MTQSTTTIETTRPAPRGRVVLEEASTLLDQMRCAPDCGDAAQGEHVGISVTAQRDPVVATLSVRVTCCAFRQRTVDWEGLILFVVRDDAPEGNEGFDVAFLDSRGHAQIDHLAPGQYRIETALVHGRSPTIVPLPRRASVLHARELEVRATPASLQELLAAGSENSCLVQSNDGRVWATVRRLPRGETAVAFETRDSALSNALVRFGFVPRSGRARRGAQVRLVPHPNRTGLWMGRWVGAVAEDAPCELVFGVRPVP